MLKLPLRIVAWRLPGVLLISGMTLLCIERAVDEPEYVEIYGLMLGPLAMTMSMF